MVLSLGAGCGEPLATASEQPIMTAVTAAASAPSVTTTTAPAPQASFLGEPDAARIASLRTEPIRRVQRGRGGRSLAFKITLEDGTQGYFKPEQTFSAAHWYSEVAAYYLDRALGFGRVPPTTGKSFPWAPLRRAAKSDKRLREVSVRRDGTVRGAFIWWVPQKLTPLRLGRAWERYVRIDERLPITPYQRPAHYRADLNGKPGRREARDPRRPLAGKPDTADRAAELSDLIVFDYLVQNVDRWGGNFTNVRTRTSGGPLIFLDNGAGFWLGDQELGLMQSRLVALQRFRRSTVEAVRAFNIDDFAATLATDPLHPVLNQRQLDGLRARRNALVAHVEQMVRRFGEPDVLAW